MSGYCKHGAGPGVRCDDCAAPMQSMGAALRDLATAAIDEADAHSRRNGVENDLNDARKRAAAASKALASELRRLLGKHETENLIHHLKGGS